VVGKHHKATYAVVAGGRLLAALQLLPEQGSIDASFAVPCQVQDGDHAMELSLVETTLREQMHPADEFEASRNHVDNGTPVEDIAPVSATRRPWSNSVSGWSASAPVVLGAFRAGELILAQVMAFDVDKGRLITEGEGRRWTRSGRANINRSTLLR
jgi:ParB family transcriptional regulator, chromosome partitioning protein